MNKVILIGRLTKDPELRQIPTGASCTTFTVAINRTYASRDGERAADFIPVITWNKSAENCAKYLTKGSQVGVSGRLQTRSYTANDGSRRIITEVVADEVEFLTPKSERMSQQTTQRSSYQSNNYSNNDADPFFGVPVDGFEEIDGLDVPF